MGTHTGTFLARLALVAACGIVLAGCGGSTAPAEAAKPAAAAKGAEAESPSVDLNESQRKTITVGAAAAHVFPRQRVAVGSIDFNEDLAVQVFPPYQGKIIQAFALLGDQVVKGRPLFTLDSPDLVQAESALIAAAGVLELTNAALVRARELFKSQGIAEKDMEQAVSDQQSAEASLKAARDAVRIFGKTEAEIDAIVAQRKIDPVLVVPSPVTGRVTARNAQPGLFVQPGNPPAPYAVADLSRLWMLANVTETDSPDFRLGQEVRVKVMAYPDRDFAGRITAIGATVDPTTRTVVVRSEIDDPHHVLRPGMFATYLINVAAPVKGVGVPLAGVVREGDGTQTIWLTSDDRHFTRRVVKIGLQDDGFDQIAEGLKEGEKVVTDGAVFLSNMLNATPND